MTRLARLARILAAMLLAGYVASSEQEEQARDGIDAWQMGHTRRLVADNCGESLWLADYRVIWGRLRVWAPMDTILLRSGGLR